MRAALDERDVERDPLRQFARWFDAAVAAQVPEPNAMTLATVDAERPALGAHRAAEGRRRARLHVLHELREPQGARARRAARGGAALLLARARAPGPHRRRRRAASTPRSPTRTSASARGCRGSARGRRRRASRCPIARRSRRASPRPSGAIPDEAVPRPPHWGGYRAASPTSFEFWQGRALAAARSHRLPPRRTRTGASGGSRRDAALRPQSAR